LTACRGCSRPQLHLPGNLRNRVRGRLWQHVITNDLVYPRSAPREGRELAVRDVGSWSRTDHRSSVDRLIGCVDYAARCTLASITISGAGGGDSGFRQLPSGPKKHSGESGDAARILAIGVAQIERHAPVFEILPTNMYTVHTPVSTAWSAVIRGVNQIKPRKLRYTGWRMYR